MLALVATGCGLEAPTDAGEASASESTGSVGLPHTFTSTVSTEKGMSYKLTYRVGTISTERTDKAPNEADITARLDAEISITNTTPSFAADIDAYDLKAAAFLPSLPFDTQDITLRSSGVGKEAAFRFCDGFLEIERFTLGPGEEQTCATSTSVTFEDLTPAEADAAQAGLEGKSPVAVTLGGYGLDWAQPADSTSDDSVVGDRPEHCGQVIGQWISGGPFCGQFRGLRASEAQDLPFRDVVGDQERPALTIVELDERDPTEFTLSATTEFFDTVDVRLDLVEELPEECERVRTRARKEASSIWRPDQPIQFLVSDPDWRAGLAFPADVRIPDDPESINEDLVTRGLWVPFGYLKNPEFNPRKKVSKSNLPYAMPADIPEDWTFLRLHYAPRIVEAGNAAALRSGESRTAGCLAEIRTIIIKKEEEQERYRREMEENRRNWRPGSGGGSFNIPGWLCPTRWC